MSDQPSVILSGFGDEAANQKTAEQQFAAMAAIGLQYYSLRFIDAGQGINRRFGSMPIAAATPFAARMSASLYRCVIGLAIALACGYVIGFRFGRGPAYVVGFCLLVLLIGMTLSLLADAIGTSAKNPESTTPLLMGPQLIFGLLSIEIGRASCRERV